MELAGLFVVLIYLAFSAWFAVGDGIDYVKRDVRERRLADPLIVNGLIQNMAEYRELCLYLKCNMVSRDEGEKLVSEFASRMKPFRVVKAEVEAIESATVVTSTASQNAIEFVIEDPSLVNDEERKVIDVGDNVSHHLFGIGRVVSITGQSEDETAVIDFESRGPTAILLRYRQVEKLNGSKGK